MNGVFSPQFGEPSKTRAESYYKQFVISYRPTLHSEYWDMHKPVARFISLNGTVTHNLISYQRTLQRLHTVILKPCSETQYRHKNTMSST